MTRRCCTHATPPSPLSVRDPVQTSGPGSPLRLVRVADFVPDEQPVALQALEAPVAGQRSHDGQPAAVLTGRIVDEGSVPPPSSTTSTRMPSRPARTLTVISSPQPCRTLFVNASESSSAASSRIGCAGPSRSVSHRRALATVLGVAGNRVVPRCTALTPPVTCSLESLSPHARVSIRQFMHTACRHEITLGHTLSAPLGDRALRLVGVRMSNEPIDPKSAA